MRLVGALFAITERLGGRGGAAVTDEVSDTIGGDERCRNVLIRTYIVAYWLANSTRLSCGVYAQTY